MHHMQFEIISAHIKLNEGSQIWILFSDLLKDDT